MRPLYIDEGVRRAVLRELVHPLYFDALDEDIAAAHGTSVEVVRALRAERARDLDLAVIVQRADELAERIDWPGTTAELVRLCVEAALDPRYRVLVEAAPLLDEMETRDAA